MSNVCTWADAMFDKYGLILDFYPISQCPGWWLCLFTDVEQGIGSVNEYGSHKYQYRLSAIVKTPDDIAEFIAAIEKEYEF